MYPPLQPFFIHQAKAVIGGLTPPLGLLYLASALEQAGETVSIIDFTAEPYSEDALRQRVLDADLVGITVLTPALTQVKTIVETVKTLHPSLPVVLGGPHATLFPAETLALIPADYLVQGDGEKTIYQLTRLLCGKKEAITGLWSRTPDGSPSGSPPAQVPDVDAFPFPARHLVRSYAYGRTFDPRMREGEFTSIITSRGCPFACRFCSRPSISAHRYRTRSIQQVILELRELSASGYRSVAIVDDCFPPPRDRAHAFFDALLQERLDLRLFVTAARVDFADEALYAKMSRAGVVSVQFGCESGCQEILDVYNKKTTVDQIRQAVILSHDSGFVTIGSFILGAPHETRDQMKATLRLAQSLPFDSVSFLPLRYMAGSELWQQAVDQGKITTDEHIVIADSHRGLSQYPAHELERICRNAQWQYYLRPQYIIRLLASTLQRNDSTFLHAFLASLHP